MAMTNSQSAVRVENTRPGENHHWWRVYYFSSG
jgi:hypothetical protein